VNGAGGTMNSITYADVSAFWLNLPANQLELALFLIQPTQQSFATPGQPQCWSNRHYLSLTS